MHRLFRHHPNNPKSIFLANGACYCLLVRIPGAADFQDNYDDHGDDDDDVQPLPLGILVLMETEIYVRKTWWWRS